MWLTNRLARFDPGYVAAAILPLIGIIPTLSGGVPPTADGPLHVQRIYAMSVLLANGDLWPRWVPYFHVGYGYPVFNFYPPGVFHLGAYLMLLGIAAPLAFNLVAALSWVIGSVGTYHLARQFLPGPAALLAAAVWTYAPSRLFEVWDQGSLPQMMAAAWVPWLFAALVRAARQPSGRALALVALPFTFIILSHQPITFIMGLFAAPAALLLPLWESRRAPRTRLPRLACTAGGLALGAALAAIFLLPMALELRYVRAAETPADALPYLISNFLPPPQLFMQPPRMDLTDLRYELLPTFGLVGGLLALVGFAALLRSRRYLLAAVLGAVLAVTAYMLLEASLPIWRAIPFFVQLRFPERFLRIGAVFLALLAGAAVLLLPRRWQQAGLALGLVMVVAAALPMAYANQPFVFWDDLSALDEINMELTAYTWGSTSYNEFKPAWGSRIDYGPPPEMDTYRDSPLRLTVFRLDMIRQWPDLQVEELDDNTARITVSDARPVRFRQFYFPGWQATLNGTPAVIYPEPELGLITLDLPPGEHIVRLWYDGTDIQRAGAVVSLLSLGLTGVLLFRGARPVPAATTEPPPHRLAARAAAAVIAGVIGFAVVNTVFIAPQTLWFRLQSPPDAPHNMRSPVNATFGEQFALLGYTLDTEVTAPGGSFDVVLFWRALTNIEREYRPIVQLVNLTQTEAWAVSEPFFPGGGKTIGYPLDRFASEVHRLRVVSTAPPYVGRILVKMIDSRTGEPLLLPDGRDSLLLDPLVRVQGSGAAAARRLDYTLGDAVELWCASVRESDTDITLDLFWHVTQTPASDLTVFVHGVDATGTIITQADGPPLNGNYPASLWLPGQTLADRFMLAPHADLAAIHIGLYTSAGRLAVTAGGQPAGDTIVLGLAADTCVP